MVSNTQSASTVYPGEAVLGAMLQSSHAATYALEHASTDWFAWKHNREVFEAIRRCVEKGTTISALNIAQEIHDPDGTLFSGIDIQIALYDLQAKSEGPEHIGGYVDALCHDHTTGRLQRVCAEITALHLTESSADALREQAISRMVGAFSEHGNGTDAMNLKQAVAEMREQYGSESEQRRFPFPFETWNRERRGGFRPAEIVVASGYAGEGKTWVALDIAERVCSSGGRVAFFSMEMSRKQLVNRMIARGGHDLDAIEAGELPAETFEQRAQTVAEWDLTIFEGTTTVDRIAAAQRRSMAEQQPYDLIVVDHLHLLHIPGRGGDYRINLNVALTRLRGVANTTGSAMLLLAQLNRATKDKSNIPIPPTLSSLRESSAIEQIADIVFFVHRQRSEAGRPLDTGSAYVRKVRQGKQPRDIDVRFDSTSLRFLEQHSAGGRSYDIA